MKRYLTSLFLICAVCLSTLAQGAFCVYVKSVETPTVIPNIVIDTIYFDSTNDGKIRQNFVTNEGVKSFLIDDIDRIKFNGERYIKATRNCLVLPKECSESEFGLVYSGVDNVQELLNVENEKYKTEWFDPVFKVTVAENKGEEREFTIPIDADGCHDEIHVRQLSESFLKDSSLFGKWFRGTVCATVNPEAHKLEIPVISGLDITLLEGGGWNKLNSDWCTIHPEKNGILTFEFEENTGEERTLSGTWGSDSLNFRILYKYNPLIYMGYDVAFVQLKAGIHSEEEHMAALRDFYDACDGKNWSYQGNWWSDKPIWEWECINRQDGTGNEYRTGHVLSMIFGGKQFNGIRGMLPESFTTIMDDAYEIDLSNGALSGAFPYKITHHPRWQEFGWNFIQQDSWHGASIDYTDINLQLPDEKVWNYKEEKESSTLTELKKHKLTWVFHAGGVETASAPVDLINKYLDYAPKGLGLIFVKDFYPKGDESPDEHLQLIKDDEDQGMPKDIIWVDHFIAGKGLGANNVGNKSLYDEAGNLVWHYENDYSISDVASKLDPIFRKYLGEPVEHDPFKPTIYTSTDYSRDGELMELQKATEGNGINVIFLGDGFVDTDMESGGKYESQMRSAMNCLFEREPLKSLSNRFNVYAIKVVSPNDFLSNGGVQALNQDLNKAAEYIARVLPDVNVAEAHVCIVENKPNEYFISGYTAMHDAGGSFAVINQGGASSVVLHEAGGHGIGKLLDEYIYAGFEDNHTQPGAEESFRQWIKTDYHDKGWGMNISATDVAEDVPWAHMLKDEYYSKETGIFMGAWYWPTELWRPSENSVMNRDYSWFNAPSREAIYKYVMKTSEGAEWTYDFETFKAWDIATQQAAAQEAKKAPKVEKEDRIYESAPVRKIVVRNGRYELEPIVAPGFVKKAPRAVPRIRTIERNGHTIKIVGAKNDRGDAF